MQGPYIIRARINGLYRFVRNDEELNCRRQLPADPAKRMTFMWSQDDIGPSVMKLLGFAARAPEVTGLMILPATNYE